MVTITLQFKTFRFCLVVPVFTEDKSWFDSQRRQNFCFAFSTTPRPTLGPNQCLVQQVERGFFFPGGGDKRPGNEADNIPLSGVDVKKAWSYTSTPPCANTDSTWITLPVYRLSQRILVCYTVRFVTDCKFRCFHGTSQVHDVHIEGTVTAEHQWIATVYIIPLAK